MARILVLGGSGEMGSAAVADLVDRTDHDVSAGDIRPDAAAALLRRQGAPEMVGRVTSKAAIGAGLVTRGAPVGVHPPEVAFDLRTFLDALAERGFVVEEREL